MANQKKKTNTTFEWTMVQVDLSEADKNKFKQWQIANVVNLETLLDECLDDGYKFTEVKSAKQGMYYVSMSQTDEDAKDGRSTLTSFANTWVKAMMLTIYKFRVICDGVISERTLDDADHIG